MSTSSTPQYVRQHIKAAEKVFKQLDTVEKKRDFLVRAGIAVRSKSAPNGIRLAKHLRPS